MYLTCVGTVELLGGSSGEGSAKPKGPPSAHAKEPKYPYIGLSEDEAILVRKLKGLETMTGD